MSIDEIGRHEAGDQGIGAEPKALHTMAIRY